MVTIKTVFWDTYIDTLDWEKNRQWIIRRVFEYGGENEILETIRFYTKDVVREVLTGIADERKKESRNENMKKYLDEGWWDYITRQYLPY